MISREISFKVAIAVIVAAGGFLLGYGVFNKEMRPEKNTYSRPTIPAIDSHLHVEHTDAEMAKLRYMAEVNNMRMIFPVGSSQVTIKGVGGFTNWEANNDVLIKNMNSAPLAFGALPTLDPEADNAPELLRGYIKQGAWGLKLYDGHSNFYKKPLDTPEKDRIYKICEEEHLPILYHVNLRNYKAEFENVLKAHPNLVVIVPHYGLLSQKLDELEELMNKYPNFYTDISFGADEFTYQGLKYLSNHLGQTRTFFNKFPTRILYASDIVVTAHPRKTKEWCAGIEYCLREFVEKNTYQCPYLKKTIEAINKKNQSQQKHNYAPYDTNPVYNGLALSEDRTRDVFYRNAIRVYPRAAKSFTEKEIGPELVGELKTRAEKANAEAGNAPQEAPAGEATDSGVIAPAPSKVVEQPPAIAPSVGERVMKPKRGLELRPLPPGPLKKMILKQLPKQEKPATEKK